MMNEPKRGKAHRPETYPTICPRCHWEGMLRLSAHPTIHQVHLKANGVIGRGGAKRARITISRDYLSEVS